MEWPNARYTDQESITNDPNGVASAATDVGAQVQVKDTAQALSNANRAQVHVRIADGPGFSPKRERNVDLGVASCEKKDR